MESYSKRCSECGWITFHATVCPMHETNLKYGGSVPMSSYATDMHSKDARIAHLEARLAVEMAEVEAWRKHDKAQWDYVNGNTGAGKRASETQAELTRCTAATDASRRAEKEKPNAQ